MLNFGVEGYGTAQSLLRYETWAQRGKLSHVFYVYYPNDPVDDLASGLFRLNGSGQLARMKAAPSRLAPLSGLHLSYLALDVTGRLATRLSEISVVAEQRRQAVLELFNRYDADRLSPEALTLFRLLLRRFKEAVESQGASFHFVWLPMEWQRQPAVANIVRQEGVDAFDLRECFGKQVPVHLRTPWQGSPYRFKNDDHWNEAGNRLAAACLYGFLVERLELPRFSKAAVAEALDRYYAAFEPSAQGLLADPAAVAIRTEYDTLDVASGNARRPWTPSPETLVIRSQHFDVHLHDGWLAYVREGCVSADFGPPFFLHVVPVDDRFLTPDQVAHGFNNHDFGRRFGDVGCTIWRALPDYPIERIRTGQFSDDEAAGFESLWEGEYLLPPWKPSPDKLAFRSRFEVYQHEGWLAYRREGCVAADFAAPFFLHVWPAQPQDLPVERLEHGFDNLDFERQFMEGTCTVWRQLPAYPLERIRTGQFRRETHDPVWEAEHTYSKD